ncbi:unnamed protein product, partial [Urochloa humidicola]
HRRLPCRPALAGARSSGPRRPASRHGVGVPPDPAAAGLGMAAAERIHAMGRARPNAGVDSAAADLIPSRRPKAGRRAPVLLPAKEGLKELRYAGCGLTPSHDADVAPVRVLRVELVSNLAFLPNACA